jgi:hypothetical protein
LLDVSGESAALAGVNGDLVEGKVVYALEDVDLATVGPVGAVGPEGGPWNEGKRRGRRKKRRRKDKEGVRSEESALKNDRCNRRERKRVDKQVPQPVGM